MSFRIKLYIAQQLNENKNRNTEHKDEYESMEISITIELIDSLLLWSDQAIYATTN